MKKLFIAILIGLWFGSCAPLAIDNSMSASDGFEPTLAMEGCGRAKINDGYLFCKLAEGGDPSLSPITLYYPKTECTRDSCIQFQILHLDGTFGYGMGLKSGETEAHFTLKDVLDSDETSLTQDGEYLVMNRIYYKDPLTGGDKAVSVYGFLRVNVMKKDYKALLCDDPSMGWETMARKTCKIQYSTKGRGAVCGLGCNP